MAASAAHRLECVHDLGSRHGVLHREPRPKHGRVERRKFRFQRLTYLFGKSARGLHENVDDELSTAGR
jgi:hypothetical protein